MQHQYPLYQREAILQQRREPPPYPGYHSAGYRQSYASSETGSTDLSLSSCENLCTSMRQDPQGEETSILASPAEAHGYSGRVQAATAVEVKSANSSTFYVTGNMQSQHEDVNMTTYTALPQMPYGASGCSMPQGPFTTPQCVGPPQLPPSTPSTPDRMQPPFIQHQAYPNQYYNPSQNQNSKAFAAVPQQMGAAAQFPILQPQQASFGEFVQQDEFQPTSSAKRHNNVKNTQPVPQPLSVSQPKQNQSKQEQPLDVNSKQDPFQKWRHFYVNQKTQLNPFKLFSQACEDQGESTGQGQTKSAQNTSPIKLAKSMSGSQLSKQQMDNVSNVRATDRLRSATPDMFSDRQSVSRQLPMRPSSANSKQRIQDRAISFAQLKQQKLAKASSHQSHNESSKKVVPESTKDDTLSTVSTMSTSSSEVDNNANKVFKHVPGGKVPSGFQTALNKFSASGQKSVSEQRKLLRSPPQSRSATRLPRPRTAPPQRCGEKARQQPQASGACAPASGQLKDSNSKELSRSCEMLDQLPPTRQQQQQQQPDSPQSSVQSLFLDENGVQFKSLSSHRNPQPASSDIQDSRNKLSNGEVDHADIAMRATKMVESLSEENQSLRQDLKRLQAKVAKLQKFEAELEKVSDEYRNLVKHSEKQESLEKVMRFKLSCEVKKLKDANKELKEQREKNLQKENSSFSTSAESELKRELKEKDCMLTKLLSQNRELNKAKDRTEIELAGEKVRSEERLSHVTVLEKALKSSQGQLYKLEDEVSRLRIRETKIEQLQSALSQLQVATEKRQTIELKLRQKLEEEIRVLKHSKLVKVGSKASDTDEGISSDSESPSRQVQTLMRQVQEREANELRLEAQVAHWEQKFYEEGALRILAVDAVAAPKDARIAALEMSSHDTERLIEQSRADRLRHLEEVYKAKMSTAELEAKVKTLELQLAERDAMVRVLNRHTNATATSLSRTSSVNSLFSSPLHSPRPSLVSPAPSMPPTTPGTAGGPLTPQLQHRDLDKVISHAKSNSEGAVLDLSALTAGAASASSAATPDSKGEKLEPSMKDLHKKLAAQAAIFQNWQKEEPDDIKKELYQV